jgi:hypothetical protein
VRRDPHGDGSAAPKVIVVLGMHRSGTSCLTGLLEQAGVFLGPVSKKNPFNLKGNHESSELMRLHEALLEENGGGWADPPSTVHWSAAARATRDAFIRRFEAVACWGFKDPRTLFTLEGWLEAIPELAPAGIFRHPMLVAQSLQRRDGFSIEQGLDLWARYNARLLDWHRKGPFPVISFDAEPFLERFRALASALGLELGGSELDFYDPGLRHGAHPALAAPLPPTVEGILRELEALAP